MVAAFGFSDLTVVIHSISHLAFYGHFCVSASASAVMWFRSKCFCAGSSFPSGVASESGTDVSGKQDRSVTQTTNIVAVAKDTDVSVLVLLVYCDAQTHLVETGFKFFSRARKENSVFQNQSHLLIESKSGR